MEFYSENGWEMADPSWANLAGAYSSKYFGKNDGLHLSYGESEAEKEVYNKNLNWVSEKGEIIGAMSAPNKFIASADAEITKVKFTPKVSVNGWNDRTYRDIDIFGGSGRDIKEEVGGCGKFFNLNKYDTVSIFLMQ